MNNLNFKSNIHKYLFSRIVNDHLAWNKGLHTSNLHNFATDKAGSVLSVFHPALKYFSPFQILRDFAIRVKLAPVLCLDHHSWARSVLLEDHGHVASVHEHRIAWTFLQSHRRRVDLVEPVQLMTRVVWTYGGSCYLFAVPSMNTVVFPGTKRASSPFLMSRPSRNSVPTKNGI